MKQKFKLSILLLIMLLLIGCEITESKNTQHIMACSRRPESLLPKCIWRL